jgi:hypothetical protein
MSSSDLPASPTKGKGTLLGENETVQEQAEGGKDAETRAQGKDKNEDHAPGLFYAYARRVRFLPSGLVTIRKTHRCDQ